VNAFLLGPIVAFLGGKLTSVIEASITNMALVSFVLAVAALPSVVAMSWTGGIGEFLGLSFVLSIFQYTLFTTITSESTTRVKPTEKGTLLGLEHTLFAAARIAAPQVGVWLLKSGGVPAVSVACGSVFLTVLGIWSVFKGTLKNGDKDDGEKKSTFCEHPGAAAERKEK
jgi:membrane protein implicated in regulation of membrane protease activity